MMPLMCTLIVLIDTSMASAMYSVELLCQTICITACCFGVKLNAVLTTSPSCDGSFDCTHAPIKTSSLASIRAKHCSKLLSITFSLRHLSLYFVTFKVQPDCLSSNKVVSLLHMMRINIMCVSARSLPLGSGLVFCDDVRDFLVSPLRNLLAPLFILQTPPNAKPQ